MTADQIRTQHDLLKKAFEPHGIQWELTEHLIKDTTLRDRTVIVMCSPQQVGNGECDKLCQHAASGGWSIPTPLNAAQS